MSHGGMPCVGVGVGHSGLIWQDTGRAYTHVSEGTACVCVSVCVWTQGLGVMGGAADGPSWCVTSMATALRAQPRFWQEFPLTSVRVRRVEGGV